MEDDNVRKNGDAGTNSENCDDGSYESFMKLETDGWSNYRFMYGAVPSYRSSRRTGENEESTVGPSKTLVPALFTKWYDRM
ncbi:hypothetical protein TNCV_1933591 [Trichonephila clavipes]|nr:hypothetical protein TNCV_1933591 [Trichonephila clavipes]